MSKGKELTGHEEPFALERMAKGYVYSCFSATTFIVLPIVFHYLFRIENSERVLSIDFVFFVSMIYLFLVIILVMFVVTIVPVTFIVIFSEIVTVCNCFYYSMSGIVVGILGGVTTEFGIASEFDIALLTGAGGVGGLVYWYVAGRNAGLGRWPRF